MHSNSHNLRSQPKKHTHTFSYTHTHTHTHKTKQRGFSPNQLTMQLNTMTYQMVGFGMLLFVCLLHEQHGGWRQKSENQQYYNGEVLHRRRIQMVFELQNGYRCKTHLDSYYS